MSFTSANGVVDMRIGTPKNNGRRSSPSTSVLIDHALSQNEALSRSNRAIDDILSQGGLMLGKFLKNSCVSEKVVAQEGGFNLI